MSSDLAKLDFDTLQVLQTLLTTRSVTETARRLGATQPSVSRSLANLRQAFEDPLLVRVGRKMEATPRAKELSGRVDEALTAMRRLIESPAPFDPARVRTTLLLAASDYTVVTILPPFFARMRREAPQVTIRVGHVGTQTVGELARGEVHLAVGPYAPIDGLDTMVMRPLTTDRFVCAMRREHPALRKPLTLERYLALDHVMIGNGLPGASAVQRTLDKLGARREVRLVLPTFLAVLAAITQTDSVAVLPRALVERSELVVARKLPFALEKLELNAIWHPRWTTDPRHRFFRQTLIDSVPSTERKRSRDRQCTLWTRSYTARIPPRTNTG